MTIFKIYHVIHLLMCKFGFMLLKNFFLMYNWYILYMFREYDNVFLFINFYIFHSVGKPWPNKVLEVMPLSSFLMKFYNFPFLSQGNHWPAFLSYICSFSWIYLSRIYNIWLTSPSTFTLRFIYVEYEIIVSYWWVVVHCIDHYS